MKVCLLSEYFYPDRAGGTPQVLSNLSRFLRDNYGDVELEVITSTNLYRGAQTKLARFENWGGIRIFRLNTPKSNRPSTLLRLLAGAAFSGATLLKLLRRPRPDVVFVVTNPPTLPLAAKIYGRLRGVPYVYLVHDLYPDVATALGVLPKAGRVARLFHAAQRSWLHGAARVVVLGRCMRDYLSEFYELPPARVEVIPNWSDESLIAPLPKETAFRRAHGLTGFVALYAGGFGQYQNFETILDAAAILQREGAGVTWVFVGEGARREQIEARIAGGLSSVRLLPFVPNGEFSDLLASADVSLVTLERGAEGLGVPSKFYNILASGRATVALVAPGCEVERVLSEADCGVRVAQDDPAALAQTMRELSQRPAELARMGANARRALLDHYTLGHVGRSFHDAFEEVIRDARHAPR